MISDYHNCHHAETMKIKREKELQTLVTQGGLSSPGYRLYLL